MESRKRFRTAFMGKKPDRVPIAEPIQAIDKSIILKIAKAEKRKQTGETYLEILSTVVDQIGLDVIWYGANRGLNIISDKRLKDKFGRIYNASPYGEVLPAEPLVTSIEEAKKFNMVSYLDLKDFEDIDFLLDRFKDRKEFCLSLSDPFKEAWRTVGGMEQLLLYLFEQPALVTRLLETARDYVCGTVDMAIDRGIDNFILVGDMAMETGLLFSPKHYREFFKPIHKEIIDYVHGKGGLIAKHSDGNNWEILGDWIDIGFDGFHPIQPQCMDIKKVKDFVAGSMSLWGNIDCRQLLVHGTPEQVRQNVKETIEIAATSGGYILTSSNSIHSGVRPENYIAMIEAAYEFGTY